MERTIEASKNVSMVFGSLDSFIKIIEMELHTHVTLRENEIKITGNEDDTLKCQNVIKVLLEICEREENLTEQHVRYAISIAGEGIDGMDWEQSLKLMTEMDDCVCISHKGKPIKPKTIGQKNYIKKINEHTITFGVGPAGTGKTYLAVASAVNAFRKKQVEKIILTRPAVEAGEKLGFLPGDLQQKVDPYLRPLYDALHDMMGAENYAKYCQRGVIEVAPLAYMRGRTLDDAFIILDEAQNTTPDQMLMFLTRIGFGSKALITGDVTQIDLHVGSRSGLVDAMKVLKGIKGIEFVYLTAKDVVRHPLVMKVIEAYEKARK